MKRYLNAIGKVGLALLVLILAAGALSAQTKIKVKDAGAVIRIEPADKGEIVQDKLVPGTVYAVESKSGDWYEIKYRSAIGVLLSGYIHKSQVEEVTEGPAPKTETGPAAERPVLESGLRPGLQIGLSGGMAFSSFTSGSGSYNETWGPYDFLQYATETADMGFTLKNPVALTASFAYFFTPNIGVRLQLDMPMKQTIQGGNLDYSFLWKWTVSSGTLSQSSSWPVTGDFSVMPISLNGVYRFPLASTMNAYVTAGPSLFLGKINAAGSMGLGWTWWPNAYTQRVEYFQMPMSINKSISGIGFNAGLGLDIQLSRSFGVFLEAAYFAGPSASENWIISPGSFPSVMTTGTNFNINESDIADLGLNTRLSPLDIKLSFMKLAAGVKINL